MPTQKIVAGHRSIDVTSDESGRFLIRESTTAEELLSILENLLSNSHSPTAIHGLTALFDRIEGADRQALVECLARGAGRFQLVDFAYKVEDLDIYLRVKNLVELIPYSKDVPVYNYNPPNGFTAKERSRRASATKMHDRYFNARNRKVLERIVQLKAERLTESEIVRCLEKENLPSANGNFLGQGGVNRAYKQLIAAHDNFRGVNRPDARVAGVDEAILNNPYRPYSEQELNPGSIRETVEPALTPTSEVAESTAGIRSSAFLDPDFLKGRFIKRLGKEAVIRLNPEREWREDFFVTFLSNESRSVVDQLFVNRAYVEDNQLRLNFATQTILIPAQYDICFSRGPEDFDTNKLAMIEAQVWPDYLEFEGYYSTKNLAGKLGYYKRSK